MEAQSFSVKRAQVEFHNFASMGQPERVLESYSEENKRRGGILRKHAGFIGPMTPFLEIGANAGHSSYMLENEFGADGFALDISADALRHGRFLMQEWNLQRAPVRMAGDALNLPFADGSLRFVCTYQTLSQFMDIEAVFREVHRVLQPGGIFLFAEEPLLRQLSLRLYRCPYYDTMKPWERKLYDWGLLGYVVRDVIGAHQEESFGIRQNHTMFLRDWDTLVGKYFASREYDLFVPQRGWGERLAMRLARSHQRTAQWLGGTVSAVCRKAGTPPPSAWNSDFETLLRCPDCHGALARDAEATLSCQSCSYRAAFESEVYNLIGSKERAELYPGDREDIIDFSIPGHEKKLLGNWFDLEGIHGNMYRWMGARADAVLRRVRAGPARLRIRGHASIEAIPGEIRVVVNGAPLQTWKLDRNGAFVVEADLPEAAEYQVEIHAAPVWNPPGDGRTLSVNIGMIRLI
jgi:ubiquinone/menaquinone biosynthesis C-methylase UbiE